MPRIYRHTTAEIMAKYNITSTNEQAFHHESYGSAGIDIIMPRDALILPNQKAKIPLGIYWNPTSMQDYAQLTVKSKWCGHLLVLGGVIDADYTGEWILHVMNIDNESFTITKGCRYVQFIVQPYRRTELHVSMNKRGNNAGCMEEPQPGPSKRYKFTPPKPKPTPKTSDAQSRGEAIVVVDRNSAKMKMHWECMARIKNKNTEAQARYLDCLNIHKSRTMAINYACMYKRWQSAVQKLDDEMLFCDLDDDIMICSASAYDK